MDSKMKIGFKQTTASDKFINESQEKEKTELKK